MGAKFTLTDLYNTGTSRIKLGCEECSLYLSPVRDEHKNRIQLASF